MCDSDNEEFESADEDFEDVKKLQKGDKMFPPAAADPKSDVEPTRSSGDGASGKDDDKAADLDPLDETKEEPKKSGVRKIIRPDKERLKEAKLVVGNVEESVDQKKDAAKEAMASTGDGWDDFDDDWGDFSVDAASATKKSKETEQKKAEANTSYKDVDIDEVENKLKDFMKRQDDPPVSSVLDRLSSQQDPSKSVAGTGQSWSGWKPSWGGAAVSFLSSASKSVASITTNITQAIESGIGVPTPEEMAKRQAEEKAKLEADGYVPEDNQPRGEPRSTTATDRFGFDQIVSGVTQISSKVITGGLDTLEGIGKKTMTILQENDPGLLSKRMNDGVVLSQVLREAKEKTEERERNLKQVQKHLYKKKLHFETLFDDYHGLVHLEALEMLSKQASLKLDSLMVPLTGNALEELQETMNEVKELCELPDSENDDTDGTHTVEELEQKLKEAVTDLDEVKVDFQDLLKCWRENLEWIESSTTTVRSSQQIFEKALHALAQTTALCVLRMHKLAEILLILEHHSTANEADALVQLTTVFCWHLSGVAARFSAELSKLKADQQTRRSAGEDSDNALITNIFLEGSNSTSYVQNAFQLFIPILQIGAA
ncbi:protein FAM114A2 [Aedes albopictus]|uniref:Microtubule-binding protein mip-t3 n=1 Tax=Aedes albopictus TaxID=7160 RepID=A0ABM1Z3R8_AEDAL